MSTKIDGEIDNEFRLFVVRSIQFRNIWTVYQDFLSGHYIPSQPGYTQAEDDKTDDRYLAGFQPTLMFVLYSFFYSLIDDDPSGINAFKIWRAKFPNYEAPIAAVEFRVSPLRDDLRLFRNKLGFHGSRKFQDQDKGLNFFGNHSGAKMWNIMMQFKGLNAALLEVDMAQKAGSTDRLAEVQKVLDQITSRCRPESTADFESNNREFNHVR